MTSLKLFNQILSKFPQKYIKFAFAYGSGVFEQTNNETTKTNQNMIDLVFIVDDSIRFHDENIKLNSSHYSFLKYFGPYYISKLQNEFGAACYYNTLVPFKLESSNDIQMIKYGVMSEKALIKDLYDWEWIYMSGRLHKPVKIIKKPNIIEQLQNERLNNDQNVDQSNQLFPKHQYSFESIDLALQTNLRNALHASLLLLPEKFTLQDLFICITSLSYNGDFRMVVGENKQKCTNIVLPQMERFINLYKPYIKKECIENYLDCNFDTGNLEQNLNHATIFRHFNLLPKNLIQTIINHKYKTNHYYDMEEFIYKLTHRVDYKECVSESVNSIVRYTSFTQSLKSGFTAGLLKSLAYSAKKLKKMF